MGKMYPFYSVSRLRMLTDGEGVTTLVAGAGCPLHCKYCINADLLLHEPKEMTAEQLYEKVKIDDLYFQATEGGVCFGGGESLLHVDFLREFRALVGEKWKIYAETSLFVEEDAVHEAAEVVDGFIVDVKSGDPDIALAYTGVDCREQIFSNLRLLKTLVDESRIRVRVPLIPDFNTMEQQHETAEEIRGMGFSRVEEFPYVVRQGEAADRGTYPLSHLR